jgi:hypothetical protein
MIDLPRGSARYVRCVRPAANRRKLTNEYIGVFQNFTVVTNLTLQVINASIANTVYKKVVETVNTAVSSGAFSNQLKNQSTKTGATQTNSIIIKSIVTSIPYFTTVIVDPSPSKTISSLSPSIFPTINSSIINPSVQATL